MKAVGIDLAAKPKNPTGICILTHEICLQTAYGDREIIELVYEAQPDIVAIDAPLVRGENRVRLADHLLKKYGAMPPTIPSLQSLVKRGNAISQVLSNRGLTVIEVFPTATAKILGIYCHNYKDMAKKCDIYPKNEHEMDAYLAALTGKLKLQGHTVDVGDTDGVITVPKEKMDER